VALLTLLTRNTSECRNWATAVIAKLRCGMDACVDSEETAGVLDMVPAYELGPEEGWGPEKLEAQKTALADALVGAVEMALFTLRMYRDVAATCSVPTTLQRIRARYGSLGQFIDIAVSAAKSGLGQAIGWALTGLLLVGAVVAIGFGALTLGAGLVGAALVTALIGVYVHHGRSCNSARLTRERRADVEARSKEHRMLVAQFEHLNVKALTTTTLQAFVATILEVRETVSAMQAQLYAESALAREECVSCLELLVVPVPTTSGPGMGPGTGTGPVGGYGGFGGPAGGYWAPSDSKSDLDSKSEPWPHLSLGLDPGLGLGLGPDSASASADGPHRDRKKEERGMGACFGEGGGGGGGVGRDGAGTKDELRVMAQPLVVSAGCLKPHAMHKACWEGWRDSQCQSGLPTTCPMCRAPFASAQEVSPRELALRFVQHR
jgi:hypothetical protein